jgi:hypothetical protein
MRVGRRGVDDGREEEWGEGREEGCAEGGEAWGDESIH